MAGTKNLVSLATRSQQERTEIARKGAEATNKIKAEKRSFKKAIEWLLNSDIKITQGAIFEKYKEMGIDISQMSIEQQMTLGVALGGIQGNATNYKTLMEGNNEIVDSTDTSMGEFTINIKDNTHLEKRLYEANKKE